MENKTIARVFRRLSQLMELHEENPFKVKSIANAYFKIDKLPFPLKDKSLAELEKIDGIGKSLATKITELLQTGEIQELNQLLQQTPTGIVDMLAIKGLGPKKIHIIWHQLGIESVGELYYACNENRLIAAKGFGLKTQDEIKNAIAFKMAANGKFLYAQIEQFIKSVVENLSGFLINFDQQASVHCTGQYRRYCEIIDELTLVVNSNHCDFLAEKIVTFEPLDFTKKENYFQAKADNGLCINLIIAKNEDFALHYFTSTGTPLHVESILALAGSGPFSSEEAIYQKAGLDFILPELREGGNEIELAKNKKLPKLIELSDLKGSLHNHSTYSDGVNTLEEMAVFCKDNLGLQYLGICDHSKSAFYAKGLNEAQVLAQQAEIDALNKKLAPFKIFKGIESDILNDGSLDYDNHILKTFDFVVASVHSNLKMDENKATARLIKAIENPYTTILGHPTGRLLLSRPGYAINFKKVIDACAANQVVIEINANPLRLDLDWRWHRYAIEKGVLLSINPDAHRTEGFVDMHYGILVARKGGLSADKCLNAFDLAKITTHFDHKKPKL